jgi:hypothetical protein
MATVNDSYGCIEYAELAIYARYYFSSNGIIEGVS